MDGTWPPGWLDRALLPLAGCPLPNIMPITLSSMALVMPSEIFFAIPSPNIVAVPVVSSKDDSALLSLRGGADGDAEEVLRVRR